ncbi:MAG: hypothetical protein WBY53_03315 [Acidobacteriaceae bacterium]
MRRLLMAQFTIKEEVLQDFQAARDKILSALSQERPKGVRYTWCVMPDERSFMGLLELDEGIENPLPNLEAGKEFMQHIRGWVAAPPIREERTVVGSYPSAA